MRSRTSLVESGEKAAREDVALGSGKGLRESVLGRMLRDERILSTFFTKSR